MTITRCYAINRDIDGDCPGSMCHSARLAQRNPPAKHELAKKSLNDEKELKRRVEIFWKFLFSEFRLKNEYFSEIQKTAILTEKVEKGRTTANIAKTVAR